MYWPVGAPKIYEQPIITALTQLALEQASVTPTDNTSQQPQQPLSNITEDGAEDNDQASSSASGSATDAEPLASLSSADVTDDGTIIGMRVSRTGQVFATITSSSISVWQAKPTAVLASIIRSSTSLKTYGLNVGLMLRPDAAILVVHTSLGYLITYSLAGDPDSTACELVFVDGSRRHARRRSVNQANGYTAKESGSLQEGGGKVHDASLRFRMVIRLDAGISQALALDDELLVATKDPPAVQCIRWTPDRSGSQTSTELLSRMSWLHGEEPLLDVVYDRPMNLFTWISADGHAFAVQRLSGNAKGDTNRRSLFKGYDFHKPDTLEQEAVKSAINSRFSLIAVGCQDGSICIYKVRDYSGGVVLRFRLQIPVSSASTGKLTVLNYSPDGYCLFAGYEKGWVTWSVYGQLGGTSFGYDRGPSENKNEKWLGSVLDAFWIGGGSDIVIVGQSSQELWILEFARSALTGCFNPANVSKGLLQTSTEFMIYQGHDMPDLTTISADVSLWHHVQAPAQYMIEQWPIRSAVISPDGRYLAIAGQRGLAHYSLYSGRWKTFEDPAMQNDFFVRGGMCWHHHVLIVAVETTTSYELRVYSRESPLDNSKALHIETLSSPVVHLTPSAGESILVYSYDNTLDHYIITASRKGVGLVRVGQIALNGIIRAPPRVRAVSWIVPDQQLQSGDPSQDVAVASVIFLVDGKLVLLKPSATGNGELKYDMRVIAQHVEYYMLARDNPNLELMETKEILRLNGIDQNEDVEISNHSLRDSLWVFDGQKVRVWHDLGDLLAGASNELGFTQAKSINIAVDFYPLSALLHKGILFGIEAELSQKRENDFSYFRSLARTTLFVPDVLRHHLAHFDSPAAQHLAYHYQHLPYFSHALEILLHNVLDEEAENPPSADEALLPAVLSFLSTFPEHLDIIVQCTRKTELRSWKTLFANLPPPAELFEAALANGNLKTAGGYLLVLHTLAEINTTSPQVVRLLRAAKDQQDWELCKELARFLMALDSSGGTLREALDLVDLTSPTNGEQLGERAATAVHRGSLTQANGVDGGLGLSHTSEVAGPPGTDSVTAVDTNSAR